ncbi:hypothetical protein [Azospirillum argentinense]
MSVRSTAGRNLILVQSNEINDKSGNADWSEGVVYAKRHLR